MNVAPIPFAINDVYQKGVSIDNSLDLAGGSLAIADKTYVIETSSQKNVV